MTTWTVDYVKDRGVQYMVPAFRDMFGRDPNFYELAFALLQSHHESSWGRGWKPPCDTSHNWGAVQSRGDGCQYQDSGPSGAYAQKFVVYPDHVAGAAGYLKEAYKRRPKAMERAAAGDMDGFVRALYASSYFTGVYCLEKAASGKCLKPDDERNIADYLKALERRRPDVEQALEALGYQRPPADALTSSKLAPYGVLALGLAAGAGLAVYARPRLSGRRLRPNRARRSNVAPEVMLGAGAVLVTAAAAAWWLSRRP